MIYAFMFRSRICRFHFETNKVLHTDFVRCEMNDGTLPHALCIEKTIVYYVISFREGLTTTWRSLLVYHHSYFNYIMVSFPVCYRVDTI